ncbi:tmcB, partial [Symbiodinium sp. KB8]
MMSIFSCPRDGTWAGTTLRCYEGSHLAWLLVVLVLLPMFACFSLFVAAVFFDRDWRSTSLVSKSHGRSDSAIILTQLAVTATFVLQDTLNVWVLRIVVLLAGIIVLFSVMYTLPFHKPGMNAYRASMAGLFLWASFCATLHGILDDPHTAAYTFWLGAPGALLAASQGVYMTLDRLAAKGVLCKNPYHDVYVQSIELAANSACLYLFYAQYLTSLSGARSRQKESMLLNKAEMRSPPLDIWFLMWQRRKQMEEDDSAAQQGQMNVLTRVAFDKHMKDAMVSGADARRNLVLFWGELKSRVPDLGRMYSLGGTLNDSIAKTEASFSALLHINRRNVDVLRKYAAFVMDVLNHPARAQTLLDEATAVEERASK